MRNFRSKKLKIKKKKKKKPSEFVWQAINSLWCLFRVGIRIRNRRKEMGVSIRIRNRKERGGPSK